MEMEEEQQRRQEAAAAVTRLEADGDQDVDPEAMFLALHRLEQQIVGTGASAEGFEWELHKENVRPLKRGRNVRLLNQALRSHSDRTFKDSLLQTRRRMIEAIQEYQGDDPLQPWLDCIKWVQESFPTGGECSGLLLIYEQCVRSFWHEERYQEDLRYLKVWMEYAESCADAEVIFSFLDANQIGQTHSLYYIQYALHMEYKKKMKKADEIYNLGIARKAKPLEKLEAVYRTFLMRLTQNPRDDNEGDPIDNPLPDRSFGTILTSAGSRRQSAEISDLSKRKLKLQRVETNKPLSVYKDSNSRADSSVMNLKKNEGSWNTLGNHSERNKENNSIPTKWVAFKVPEKKGGRTSALRTSTCIEVYVDEECAELPSIEVAKSLKPEVLKVRLGNGRNLKKETEMLKENPLRNFPINSLR